MLGHSTLYEPRLGWVHEWTNIRFEWEGSWEYESNKKKKKKLQRIKSYYIYQLDTLLFDDSIITTPKLSVLSLASSD